ncbi:iron uptake porin [Anabaena azotica]|uniref:Iron uptake porin n=1 Tax=Anabaena azotica FACHB-119 TaxID=947527 RepID=A0ABR8D421_9NOST|nr:iron uptake porin [Anabaena azotica]MBD2500513.1 iron uptake porin [Anabaena azotica FACHB-119]
MTKLFWNALRFSPVVFAATLFATNSALAAEANEKVTSVSQLAQATQSQELGQEVTSVSQLTDVQPTDWAFQALQSLVERYGCIVGYPNRTYRGNRALTRYEFAAGLNACLDRVNELIATATADLVRKEDLATLQRLQEEFSAELATLRGRVDALEARTSELEANQFSTTTKLVGEAVFSVSDSFGGDQALSSSTLVNNPNGATRDLDSNVTFSYRTRLSLNSSFTGKDQLQIRLQAGNVIGNNSGTGGTGTNMTRLAYDNNTSNSVEVDKINYAFNLSDAIRVKIDANTGEFYENINTFNPVFASSSRGAISRYGRFSPIYRQGAGGAGVTVNFNSQGPFTASVGYLAGGSPNTANDPSSRAGLFDGDYALLAQVGFQPSQALNLGFTYVRSYQNSFGNTNNNLNLFSSTGSDLANRPFGNVATSANHFGVQATFRPSSTITVGGWAGLSYAEAASNGTGIAANTTVRSGDNAELFYWGVTLGLQDFGREGNVLGFIFGQPPKVTDNDVRSAAGVEQKDADTSYHLEGLYRIQVNDRISVTPALLVIFNPEHNDRNDTIYVGTLRTTFTF